MNDLLKKFTVGLVSFSMVLTLIPVSVLATIPAAPAAPTPTVAELQALITALRAEVAALRAEIAVPAVPAAPAVAFEGVPAGFTFERNLRVGMVGPDVRNLQIILNADPATRVAETGAGSPGRETNFFGPATRAAVAKFQTENEISPAAGFVGPITRAALNALLAVPVTPITPVTPVTPVTPEIPVVPATPTAVLSPVTPAAAALPQNARMVPVLTVDITAGAEALTISAMRFKRTGLGEPGDWSELHLFEGGVRITDFGRSVSVDTHEIEFPTLAISIPAGQTRSYTLRANVAGIPGRQGAFELIGITSNIAIPGLPVRGNLMNISSVAVGAVTINPGLLPVSPMVGAQNVEIASLRVVADANAVALEQIAVAVSGNIRRGDVTNLHLYHGTTRLATTPALNVHDKAVFVLSPAFNIARERTETLTVRADLAGRVGESILTRIADAEDVIAIDQRLGFGARITNNVSTAGALGNIALLGGRLTLADQGPAARNVAVNTSDVVLTQIGMTAERNLEVRRLVVNIPGGGHTLVSNLRIRDAVTGETLMGPVATPTAVNNMTGSFTLTAGVTRNITVTANTLAVAGGVSANLVADLGNANVDIRDIGTGAALVAADVVPHTVTGKTQTIVVAGLRAGLLGAPIPATVVTGAANVPAVGFSLAAVGADVTVRSLEARIFVNTATNFAIGATEVTDPNRVVTLARLMDGTTVLGTAVLSNVSDAHDYGRVRFTGLNLRITRETARNLTVQISAGSGLTATNHVAVSVLGNTANVIDAVDAEGRTVTVAGDVNLVVPNTPPARVITITTAGTLAAVRAAGSPVAAIIPVGITRADNQTLTLVRFTTEREPIIIEELRVIRAGSAPETAYLAVDLVDGATVLGSGVFGAGMPHLDLTGLNVEIPIAGRTLGLRANLAGVGVGVTSGQTVQLDAQITRARGANSGAALTVPIPGATPAVAAATATAAITVPAAHIIDRTLNIDGVAITFADGATATDIATAIRAAFTPVIPAHTVTVGGAAGTANVIFTNRVGGTVGNRTVAMTDAVYAGGTIPTITMAGGIDNATDRIARVTIGPGVGAATEGADVFRVIVDGHEMATTGHITTNAAASALVALIDPRPAVSAVLFAPNVIEIRADNVGGGAVADTFTLAVSVIDTGVANPITIATPDPTPAAAATPATVTITVTAAHDPNRTLNIDGAAITFGEGATAAEIATAIRAAVNAVRTPARTVDVTGEGAVLIFTNRAAGVDGNRTVVADDRIYAGGVIPVITMTGGVDARDAAAAVPVSGHPMTIRQTVPTVTITAGTATLRAGENHAMTVTVAAPAQGDVTIRSLRIERTLAGGALSTDVVVRVAGVVVPDERSPDIVAFTTPEVIAAGTSRAYRVYLDGVTAATGASIVVRLLGDATASATGNFIWRDGSTPAVDINGFLVPGIPSPSFSLTF